MSARETDVQSIVHIIESWSGIQLLGGRDTDYHFVELQVSFYSPLGKKTQTNGNHRPDGAINTQPPPGEIMFLSLWPFLHK